MGIKEYQLMLAAVRWNELDGAYNGFPLAERMAAIDVDEILGHVCHQDVLEAGAVPVARAWAQLADGSAGPEPLRGLEYLASNTSHGLSQVGRLRYRGFAGTNPWPSVPQLQRILDWERWSDGVLAALVPAAPALTAAVRDSEDAAVRFAAAALLRYLPASAGDRNTLVALVMGDGDPALRASLTVAIVSQARDAPPAPVLAAAVGLLDAAGGATRACAAAVLLLALPHPGAVAVQSRLPQLLTDTDTGTGGYLSGYGLPVGFVAEALVASRLPDDVVTRTLLDAFAVWCGRPREDGELDLDLDPAHHIGERIFERAFAPHLGRRDYLTGNDLNALQCDVLSTLADLPPQPVGQYASAAGLRLWGEDVPRLLGHVNGGLDAEVTGEWFGRPVRWPVWKWWWQARDVDRYWPGQTTQALDLVGRILCRGLSPEQVRAAIDDARGGAYNIRADHLLAVLNPHTSAPAGGAQSSNPPSPP